MSWIIAIVLVLIAPKLSRRHTRLKRLASIRECEYQKLLTPKLRWQHSYLNDGQLQQALTSY